MSGPVVLLGLDACDAGVAVELARAGAMPNLARLLASGARCTVRNPYGLFVGAIWPTISTAVGPARHGVHCWETIDVETYEHRALVQPEHWGPTFWEAAGEAGRRVAILDVPHTKVHGPVNGVQLVEWGCHDRHYGLHSWPPSFADDAEAAVGLHPVLGMDARERRDFAPDDYVFREQRLRSRDEEVALLQGLLGGLDAKRRLTIEVLRDEPWDLFVSVFGESHAVGHQQWHLHDAAHPRHDPPALRAVGGDPVAQVYRRLDAAVGDVVDATPAGATILLLLSHGMGPHFDGTHLLDQVLHRIDHVDRGGGLGSGPVALAKRAAGRLPDAARFRAASLAAPLLRAAASRRGPAPCDEFVSTEARAQQRFYLSPNNFVVGGVRLNLIGREPLGCVDPSEVDAVVAALRRDLRDLVNVATGGPVIRDVQPNTRWYEHGLVGSMPDLFVEWERTAPIETVWSPKVGLVHGPYTHWRTGDHRPAGLLVANGPGLSGGEHPSIRAEDLAPSVLGRLGVPFDDVEGAPVPWLAGGAKLPV